MSVVISLRDVVNEMVEAGEDQTAFVNRRTGEVITLTDGERYELENVRAEDVPETQRELQEALRAGDLLELPSAFEHHQYSIVERFCHGLSHGDHRDLLLKAIHGKRAFRDFTQLIGRFGLEAAWAHFREQAYEELAIDWLVKNDLVHDQAA
jgi:hypothetical protein